MHTLLGMLAVTGALGLTMIVGYKALDRAYRLRRRYPQASPQPAHGM